MGGLLRFQASGIEIVQWLGANLRSPMPFSVFHRQKQKPFSSSLPPSYTGWFNRRGPACCRQLPYNSPLIPPCLFIHLLYTLLECLPFASPWSWLSVNVASTAAKKIEEEWIDLTPFHDIAQGIVKQDRGQCPEILWKWQCLEQLATKNRQQINIHRFLLVMYSYKCLKHYIFMLKSVTILQCFYLLSEISVSYPGGIMIMCCTFEI